MPKLFGREIHPIVLLGVTGVAIYLVMGALQPPDTIAPKPKTKATAKKSNSDVDYVASDFTAQFASLSTVVPRDAFRPLITKGTTSVGQNPSIDNFTYSGMALLNNEPNGLLENSTTGEGDFVKPGQHWHQQWLVVSVTPDQIDLKNDIGEDTVLKVGASSSSSANSSAAPAATGNAPFNPAAMVGQIGNQDLTMQPDPNAAQPQNNAGGRGRGRGRGAGGGRRGGGGNNGNGGMSDGGN